MTTIVYREGILASDGRMSCDGDIMHEDCVKIHKMRDGTVFGVAGTVHEIIEFTDAMLDNDEFNPVLEDVFTELDSIAIHDGELWFYSSKYPRFQKIGKVPYWAIGSGEPYAKGALEAGAGAIRAVEIACKFDADSGGTIRHLTVD